MTKIIEYTNDFGVPMIEAEFDDGSAWSGYKSAWDVKQANAASTK
jgi:hypothetical protein